MEKEEQEAHQRAAAAGGGAAAPLTEAIEAWKQAQDSEGPTLACVVAECTPAAIEALSPAALQQLITLTLQAEVTGGHGGLAKAQLEGVHRALLTAAPTTRLCESLDAVLRAHTPLATTSGAPSRRNSLTGPIQARSRRNSLAAPLEEQAVASMRLQAFKLAFEITSAQTIAAVAQASKHVEEIKSHVEVEAGAPITYSVRVHLRGLSDVWSAVRKATASDLASSKLGALIPSLPEVQLHAMFEDLMAMAGVPVATDASPSRTWQEQEGAMAGVTALFRALRLRQQAQLPAFLANLSPERFFPLLAHAQLTVREHTTGALQGFVDLLQASGARAAADNVKQRLVQTLMDHLRSGMTGPRADELAWVADYEAEGHLTVIRALGVPCRDAASVHSYVDVLSAYLAHPASSVRQQASEILAQLALDFPPLDLLEELRADWQWEAQEQEAAIQAHSAAAMMGDAHTPAVYFALPPPLSLPATASHSRCPSSSGVVASSLAAPGDAASTSTSSPPQLSHRATWQWKEGALMALELFLRGLPSHPRAHSARDPAALSRSLAHLYQQVARASLSWSWELRRMSEQIRTPFFGVWMALPQAGADIIALCVDWLQVTTSSPATAHVAPVSLLAAASCTIALQSTLAHLHKSRSSSAVTEKEDTGCERKWNQELEQGCQVHTNVWRDLSIGLPPLLNRVEQLVVSAMLHEHGVLSNPALNSSPSVDNLATLLRETTPTETPMLITWEQFATLAVQAVISAYAMLGAESSIPAATSHSMRVSQQSQLQHYQCVLDRLRTISSLSAGDAVLPAPSVAAQAVTSSPRSHPNSVFKLPLLPTLSSMHTPTITPVVSEPPCLKLRALHRARAKRLESWLLAHASASLVGFAACVPPAAHVDLLDLLLDYLTRFHGASSEIRIALLRAITIGWTHTSKLYPTTHVWSHQMHQLQDHSLTLLLQLLHEHALDRAWIVAALIAIVGNSPLDTNKLHRILESVGGLVSDDYLTISLDAPPPPSPVNVLSPTSAAAAAETEAWDDWDEDSPEEPAACSIESATECFLRAKQLIVDVAPLLLLLEAQSYVTTLSLVASPPRTISASPSSLAHSIAPTSIAHAQSSLAQLVAAYEHASTSVAPDAHRQIELLQWIQQWASQVQHQIADSSASPSPSPPRVYSTHDRMPINTLFQSTWTTLPAPIQAKLSWLQQQGSQLRDESSDDRATPSQQASPIASSELDQSTAAVLERITQMKLVHRRHGRWANGAQEWSRHGMHGQRFDSFVRQTFEQLGAQPPAESEYESAEEFAKRCPIGTPTTAIPRLAGDSLSVDQFRELFSSAEACRPVIIGGLARNWPMSSWTVESLVSADCPYAQVRFKVDEQSSHDEGEDAEEETAADGTGDIDSIQTGSFKLKLHDFMQYLLHTRDDVPLYVFDAVFECDPVGAGILSDFEVPKYFNRDLFRYLGEVRRPPYRWMLIGPQRSGSSLHTDPLSTAAWNTCIDGIKRWVLFPPGTDRAAVKGAHLAPPNFASSPTTTPATSLNEDDEADAMEAAFYFTHSLPILRATASSLGSAPFGMVEFLQFPGETVFVPDGWLHAVINVTHTIAVTQNLVLPDNFPFAYRDARLQRPHLARRWIEQLRLHEPEVAARAARIDAALLDAKLGPVDEPKTSDPDRRPPIDHTEAALDAESWYWNNSSSDDDDEEGGDEAHADASYR